MQKFATNSLHNETDESLLRRVVQHDATAYEAFYERHAQTVYNVLARIVHDANTAEELVQEVFWQVWQKADQYAGSGAPAAWLLRMARNKAIDQIRYTKARPTTIGQDYHALERAPELVGRSVEQTAEQGWQRQQIRQVLASIPEDQRVCLELAYFEGLSQREIAEQTNTPLGTIKTRMSMGLQKLERMLRAIGYP